MDETPSPGRPRPSSATGARMPSLPIRNITAYMAAGLLPNLVNFILLPVYTRFLTPSDYGLIALVTALTSFLSPVLGLQLANSLSRMFFDYDETGVKKYFTSVFIAILGINLVLLTPIHILGEKLTSLIFPNVDIPYHPYVFLGLVTVFFRSFTNYCNILLRVLERGGTFLTTAAAHTVVAVSLGVYLVIVREMGAYGFLLAQALTAMLHAAVLLVIVRGYFTAAFSPAMVKAGLSYSLPLIPHGLGGVLFMYTDKYILSYFVPLGAIGLYDIAGRFAAILRKLVASFHMAVTPSFMSQSIKSKREAARHFSLIITKWSVVISFLYLFGALFSEEFIHILLPEKFRAAYAFVPILMGAFLFRNMQGFTINSILFEKKTVAIPFLTVTAGIFNVVANILLIPRYGVIAAAWATFAAYAISFCLSLYFSNRVYPLKYEWKKLIFIYGFTLLLLLLVLFLKRENVIYNVSLKSVAMVSFCLVLAKLDYGHVIGDLKAMWKLLAVRAGFSPDRKEG
jgi:O-antigen/teichoic acid export membrane protein